jgi:fused signal recognition particle receptor
MFSFFKKKKPEEAASGAHEADVAAPAEQPGFLSRLFGKDDAFVPEPAPVEPVDEVDTTRAPDLEPDPVTASVAYEGQMFPETAERPGNEADKKLSWMARLKAGLSKTSSNLSLLFVGARIDEDLYEELEGALLMSDAGMDATQYLLDNLRRKVKEDKLLDAAAVKGALRTLLVDLLRPLEKPLELGRHAPMVMMIAGVNGAGKTTTIGKLAKHMQRFHQSVLLAAGDTFRAAAREQLMVWGQRNNVTVISQASGDRGRGRLRRRPVGPCAWRGRGHGRHGRPPADPAAPDGRTAQDQARDRQGHG